MALTGAAKEKSEALALKELGARDVRCWHKCGAGARRGSGRGQTLGLCSRLSSLASDHVDALFFFLFCLDGGARGRKPAFSTSPHLTRSVGRVERRERRALAVCAVWRRPATTEARRNHCRPVAVGEIRSLKECAPPRFSLRRAPSLATRGAGVVVPR